MTQPEKTFVDAVMDVLREERAGMSLEVLAERSGVPLERLVELFGPE